MGSFRDYWIKKLLFSKVFMLDSPGVIVSGTSKFFGSSKVQKRDIYHFEIIFRELKIKTIEKLGFKEASKMFYKIGKDLGTGYLLLANVKKLSPFLIPVVMKALCKITWASGVGVSRRVSILDDGRYVLEGSDTMFCNGVGDASFYAGVYSGFLSYLSGKNIEAISACHDCPKGCKIILDPSFEEIYIPDIDSLKLDRRRSNVRLSKNICNVSRPSFSDLVRFGKIDFSNNKLSIKGEGIFSTEQEMFDLVTRYYLNYGLRDFFEDVIIESSSKLSKKIFVGNGVRDNFEEMLNVLCAFGWGIPSYSIKGDEILLNFARAPGSTNKPFYRCLVINGFLNNIFGENYKIKNICTDLKSETIKIVYNKI